MKIIAELFDLTKRYIRASIRERKFKKIQNKMYKRIIEKMKTRKEAAEA